MSNLGEPITIEELLDNAKAMDLSHLAVFFDISTAQTYAKPISDFKDLLQNNFQLNISDISGLQANITEIEGDISSIESQLASSTIDLSNVVDPAVFNGEVTINNILNIGNPSYIVFSDDGESLQDKLSSLQSNIDNIDLSAYLTNTSGASITNSTWFFDSGSYIYAKLPSNIYFEDYNGVGSGDDLGNILSQFLAADSSPIIDNATWTFASGSTLDIYDPTNIYFSNLSNDLGTILSGFLNSTDDQSISAYSWDFGTTSFNIYDPSYIYFSNDSNSLDDRLTTLQSNIDNIDLSNYLTLDGSETLTGPKTFSSGLTVSSAQVTLSDKIASLDDVLLDLEVDWDNIGVNASFSQNVTLIDATKLIFDDLGANNTLQDKLDNISIDLSNYTDAVDFGNTVNFNNPAAITFDSGDDLQDIIDSSISAIDFSNYVTLNSNQTITGIKTFNGDVNFNDNTRFYFRSDFYKRPTIAVSDSSLQSLYGSLFKTSDGHNNHPVFTEDYGQIDENDPSSPYPVGEKTAYLGARQACYINDKDFLDAANITGDQLDALNHSFVRTLTNPFYNVYSIPHSVVMLDFTGNISDAGNQIELFGVTFSLTEAGNSLSQLVVDLNTEFDTYEEGGANELHANASSISRLRAVAFNDATGTYADPGDQLLYILSDAPERLYVTLRTEFNLVGANDVTNYYAWNLQARKPFFTGAANLIDSIDHVNGTYQIRHISQGGNSRDLDSISFIVDKEGNVGVGSSTHPIAEFDPAFDQKLGMLKTLGAKFEIRGFGYGSAESEDYKPAFKTSKGDSTLELDTSRNVYGRTYEHEDFKNHQNKRTRVFASDFADVSASNDHNAAFVLDWSHHNQIIELSPTVSETIVIILSNFVSDWDKFTTKIINLGQGIVKLNFAINSEAAMESISIYDNIEIYNRNNSAWRALNNNGFTGTTANPTDTQYSRTYSITQGVSNFGVGESEFIVIGSDSNIQSQDVEVDINISGALITKTANNSAEDYVDSFYTIWREGFNNASQNLKHYYGGAFSYVGHNNRGVDYGNQHSNVEALLGWYQNQAATEVTYGRMEGTINNNSDFAKYVHANNALERITTPGHYVLPAIRFNTDIGWIPVLLLPYLSQSGDLNYSLGSFQTPYLGAYQTTLATARGNLEVNPNKLVSDTVYDLRYHNVIWNLYQKHTGNSYNDAVISGAHPYSLTINLQYIESTFGVGSTNRMSQIEFSLITAAKSSVTGGLVEHSPIPIDNSDAQFNANDITRISGAYDIDMLVRYI